MLNEKQREDIINFLNHTRPVAAAYFARMAARKQHSRMSPSTFEICENIISEFGNESSSTTEAAEYNDENSKYLAIIKNATAELIGERKTSRRKTMVDNIKSFFTDEKTPNMSHGGIQKQFFNNTVQIFANRYGRSPSVVNEYVKIAKKDFPGLKSEDIRIVVFGGIRKKGIMGIRFSIPADTEVPGDYFEWSDPYNLDELID